MKKTLLVLTTIITSMTFAQDCSDLFISEYVEGWSNNKALEIYKSELMKHPFPRSIKAVKALSLLRGSECGYEAAESFMILKKIKK